MKIIAIIILILTVAIIVTVIGCRKRNVSSELKEFSTSFNLQNLQPFLSKISDVITKGFSDAEINEIVTSVNRMKPDEQREFYFDIRYKDKASKLKVSIFMDDIDAPDVYFYSCPELSSIIEGEFIKFANELGI
jgi:hypothetical protein